MSPIPIIHILLAAGVLIYAVRSAWRQITLLNAFTIIFILCCAIGLNLLPLFPESVTVALSETALHRAMFATMIFAVLALVALVLQNEYIKGAKSRMIGRRVFPSANEFVFIAVLASIVISFFLAMWLTRNRQYGFFEAYTATTDSGQYYQYRKFVEEDVIAVSGRGTWTAKKLVINIGPMVMVFLGYLAARLRRWVLLIPLVIQGILGILVAGMLAHKSYLLIAFFSPLIAALIWRMDKFKKSVFVGLFLVSTVTGALVFQAATGLDFLGSLNELFIRIVIVPAYVAALYFEVVPDALPFRGILETLYIYNSSAPIGDYSVHDVAMAASGRVYGANAHFVAVAYTGMGHLGVLLICALAFVCAFEVDRRLMHLEPIHRMAAIIIPAPAVIGITSVHFLGAMENGFLIQSFAFYLMALGWQGRTEIRVTDELTTSSLRVGESRSAA